MTFLQQLLSHAPGTSLTEAEERYWTNMPVGPSATGIRVTPETALKISTFWACVGLISETVASLPAILYERLDDGGRARAMGHPLWDVLHTQPNAKQTAFEFYEMMTGHTLIRGNAYAKIMPGARGPADQLIPLHPDKVIPEKLPDGSLRYRVTEANGEQRVYNDEDILHLKGRTNDGQIGLSVVAYARESLGMSLAAEGYGARFFGNDSRPGGVLKMPGKLSPEAAINLKASWENAHRGVGGAHRVAVLEEGLEWQAIGMQNRDAQFLETREFQAEDICRWLRVPPHMVGLTSKATSWGTGIEQMSLGFVIYTLMPWLVRWQQAISRDLIIAPRLYFVEFLVDALLRGDLRSRYDAYAIARNWGWLSVNDIRRKENENPIEGGDTYLQPLNMMPANAAGSTLTVEHDASAISSEAAPPGRGAHYAQLLYEAVGRVVRKEIAALNKAARRDAPETDSGAWMESVHRFYSNHAEFVSHSLQIPLDMAQEWVAEQVAELAAGAGAMSDWETRRVAELVTRIMESQYATA